MKAILVIGATGTVGSEVVAQLRDDGVPVRALSRNGSVRGDLNDPDSLVPALEGVETVFLVWTAPAEAAPAAIARIAEHAKRIVVLSAPYKTPHPFFQQPNRMAAMQAEIDRLIETSGMSWTFVRPGMFAANALAWWAPQIRSGDVVRWPYADAPTAPIHERDIGAVAVRALMDTQNADYVITGPESLTQREQVEIIGEVIGRRLRFEETPGTELPRMLLNAWAAALGQPAYITNTVAEVTGRPARTFREWVTDHAASFVQDP